MECIGILWSRNVAMQSIVFVAKQHRDRNTDSIDAHTSIYTGTHPLDKQINVLQAIAIGNRESKRTGRRTKG